MSKVVITNTTNAPVFVAGRLLTCGASIEAFEHEVPDCLRSQIPKAANAEPESSTDEGGSTEAEKVNEDELAEEGLIAAAGKNK